MKGGYYLLNFLSRETIFMKLTKRLFAIGLSALAAGMLGVATFSFAKNEKNVVPAKATSSVDLESVITTPEAIFAYNFIGQINIKLPLSVDIFSNGSTYANDNLNAFKDENGNPINVGDGLLINDKTLRYWAETYPSPNPSSSTDNGVFEFPLRLGGVHSPFSAYFGNSAFQFRFNLDVFSMDSIKIQFVAGVFKGYNNSTYYELDHDLIYYTSLNDSDGTTKAAANPKISIVKAVNEVVKTDAAITNHYIPSDGVNVDNGSGYHYYKYHVGTNIKRDLTLVENDHPFVARNYRYIMDNVLMNGKPITYYNDWARLNKKDFTDYSDRQNTRTPEYKTETMSHEYDTAVQVRYYTDQSNYFFAIFVPNQIMTDLSLGEPGSLTFTLRDGSAWRSLDNSDNPIIVRAVMSPYDHQEVTKFVDSVMHFADISKDNNTDTGACRGDSGYYLTAKKALNLLTVDQVDLFQRYADFADAKARYEAWAVACGDAAPYDGNDTIVSSNVVNNLLRNTSSDCAMIVVTIVSVLSISVVGVFFLFRKKRHN